ncbi:MAG: DUF1634 domain-containing protein [Aulosira sp. ZfuVER01]|nr:DUF1634 domain-containing protein [Aulosira sp. ZfuVER01]MDZ8000229.1 DUF1634 domain-containing protein [Aulosira sp. DedVER01a]MDZ8053403.1 DUF1634 domain-containing protein [Aulosira sp. ZfuCHP01]
MTFKKQTKSERRFEQFIGNFLRIGVILATSLVLLGGILYLIRHGGEVPNYQFFRGEPTEFRTPDGLKASILSGRNRGLIQLGLLLLIATPVLRVAFSLLAFIRLGDFFYVIVTLIVLFGLAYSLIG